jgi:hypothetical protein
MLSLAAKLPDTQRAWRLDVPDSLGQAADAADGCVESILANHWELEKRVGCRLEHTVNLLLEDANLRMVYFCLNLVFLVASVVCGLHVWR